jgi:putative intracellular protease/amidase
MLEQEVGVMIGAIEEAGFRVVVASGDAAPIKDLSETVVLLQPDLSLADVRVRDYVGIIIPCMAQGWFNQHAFPEEIALVQEAIAQGKSVAAQCGSIIILGEAGVLAGKTYAFGSDWSQQFEGAIYGGPDVVRDGNIITSSRCAERAKKHGYDDQTLKLTNLFIEAIKEQNN